MNYFERTLASLRIFGDRHAFGLDIPTKQNARKWLDRIENELSPENLSCDGELRGAALRAKEKELLYAKNHCLNLLGIDPRGAETASQITQTLQKQLLGAINANAITHQHIRAFKQKRNIERRQKLNAALHQGFLVGARVQISNGHRGTIIKINQTRVKVKAEDGRLWSVPPRCMTLLKVR